MIRTTLAVTALALLAACGDGQPFPDGTETPTNGTTPETDPGIDNGGATPPLPGTASPSPDRGIVRFEASAADGSSLIEDVSYDAANDTFTVDGLGFDGANVYSRLDGPLRTLGPARVFAADERTPDSVTNTPITQFVPYRAIYVVSRNQEGDEPRTSLAVVRTGAYVGYGFGGFVYQRNGGVVLPSTGQAQFTGPYAGMRVFEGRGGLEYTTGDMLLQIDFEDFNANDAVFGQLRNRTVFNERGEPILELPDAGWRVVEGTQTLSENGEISGEMFSTFVNEQGALEEGETGTFSGILSGDLTTRPGGEVVGVIVLEGEDPRTEGVTVQETGGAVLYRD